MATRTVTYTKSEVRELRDHADILADHGTGDPMVKTGASIIGTGVSYVIGCVLDKLGNGGLAILVGYAGACDVWGTTTINNNYDFLKNLYSDMLRRDYDMVKLEYHVEYYNLPANPSKGFDGGEYRVQVGNPKLVAVHKDNHWIEMA